MNGKYIYIDVVDTAVLCNLEIQESTLHNEEVKAKCPYCKDYKYIALGYFLTEGLRPQITEKYARAFIIC